MTERVAVLANGRGAFGAYWELAQVSNGRFMVWRERVHHSGTRATLFDTEPEAREYFDAYTTSIVEVR